MAYKGPEGPPPSYPPQAYDAGPYQQPGNYGSPAPPTGGPGPYGPPPGNQDYYGSQQQGYNQPPMQYQQQPMYPQQGQGYPPPQGQYYQDDRGRGSSSSGICAGIMGALACCCCLDCLF